MVFQLKHKLGGIAPFFYIYIIKLKVMELLEQIINAVKEFFFGKPVQGERPKEPSFRSTYPEEQLSEFEWYEQMNVGIMLDKQCFLFG
jgi:hypothetical protein